MKRSREEHGQRGSPPKRPRTTSCDRLSLMSDELLLRTLSYLSVSELVLCQRLSRRLQSLAGDLQLWKALFYDRFVRPRASRLPGAREQGSSAKPLHYSSKLSRWLDDEHLVKKGRATNWKRQYKLRHNWSKGRATISETRVAEQPSSPALLVRLRDDIAITADASSGLRAWSLKCKDRVIAHAALCPGNPSSLAIDDSVTLAGRINISVGFDDGSFVIYMLWKEERKFFQHYRHAPSTNGAIHAIAYASPYLLTMTALRLLSLYRVCHSQEAIAGEIPAAPRLLSSLRSHTAYSPISLAIRASHTSIVASIAYAMPTWSRSWSVGLQELRLTIEGDIEESRVATAQSSPTALPAVPRPVLFPSQSTCGTRVSSTITRPTSLSYNHPYLLSAHADNTLTLYMVSSNAEELCVGPGNRLWGHTSSVSGAHIGDRGKAVSVSAFGNELRVWELEGGLSSSTSRRRAAVGDFSVEVRPENQLFHELPKPDETAHVAEPMVTKRTSVGGLHTFNINKGWVSFDEEKVVLLKEQLQGAQDLVVYEFS